MDKLIVDFEKKITEDIKNSGLPIQVVRLVLMEAQGAVNAECLRQKAELENNSKVKPKKEEKK